MAGCFCTGACRATGVCPVGGMPKYLTPFPFVTATVDDYDTTIGVWVVWEYNDAGAEVVATFGREIDALRFAVHERDCMNPKVCFLLHGITLRDHLKAADSSGTDAG